MAGTTVDSLVLVLVVSFVSSTLGHRINNSSYAPECFTSEDCVADRACTEGKCVNPCLGLGVCGPHTVCHVNKHTPTCACAPGATGHPFTGCEPTGPPTARPEPPRPVIPAPVQRVKKFYVHNIVKVNWYQALALCNSLDMRLASFSNQQEFDQLAGMVRQANLKDTDYWLSGSDLGRKGQFVWMSTGAPVTSGEWQRGEPNNAGGMCREVEHCVELTRSYNYRMNDEQCSELGLAVCEHYQ